MSNIFQPFVRSTQGAIPINVGVGPIVDPIASQSLNIDSTGAIHVVPDATINHYTQGLPFDENGRLALTLDPKVRVDQGIPFAANGSISVGSGIGYIDQGLAYTLGGGITFVGDVPVTLWTIEENLNNFGFILLLLQGDLVPRGEIQALYAVVPSNLVVLAPDDGVGGSGFVEVTAFGLTIELPWDEGDQSYQLVDPTFTAAVVGATNTTVQVSGVHFPELLPEITEQPEDTTVLDGGEATFNSAANNFDTVQWFENGSEFVGQTSPILTFTAVLADDGNTYFARYTSVGGSIDTDTATLGVVEGTNVYSPVAFGADLHGVLTSFSPSDPEGELAPESFEGFDIEALFTDFDGVSADEIILTLATAVTAPIINLTMGGETAILIGVPGNDFLFIAPSEPIMAEFIFDTAVAGDSVGITLELPIENIYLNPEFAGGADDIIGSSAGVPEFHGYNGNDVISTFLPPVGGLPPLKMNDENNQVDGRRNLFYFVNTNNTLFTGRLYRIEYTVENDPGSAITQVMALQGIGGPITIHSENLDVAPGTTGVVFYEFSTTDPTATFAPKVGNSVLTTESLSTVTISNPGLFDIGPAP